MATVVALTLENFKYPILVTTAYFILYYAFVIGSGFSKFPIAEQVKEEWRKKHGDKARITPTEYARALRKHPTNYKADRVQLNMLEQMPPFLVSLWLHAIFVSPINASIGGVIYIVFRALYPFVYGSGLIVVSTIPNYIVILYLMLSVGYKAL